MNDPEPRPELSSSTPVVSDFVVLKLLLRQLIIVGVAGRLSLGRNDIPSLEDHGDGHVGCTHGICMIVCSWLCMLRIVRISLPECLVHDLVVMS